MRKMPGRWIRAVTAAAIGATATWLAGCARHPAPPGPGEFRGAIPDLRGHTVLVLPVQLHTGISAAVPADPELAYALRTRGEGVTWVLPPEVEEILSRSPSVQARTRGLEVGMFLRAEVERVGDPLFGQIRRLSALTGADVALLPVELRYGKDGALQLSAAVIATRTGRVTWYGVVEGAPGAVGAPATLASVAETLARTLLPFG